ncbi:hypothetical protein CALCODRAFT_486326 [Calocera cornea HHB12733]|uniref:Uncharacterized protein n=1 Tax=Calocera cornea HHB12733 TaxID=1353952 RepID=A0A165DT79_9BASI|nr:hypothetical protein CALCODRAFT_486427 [Calocera cornea HHB12733]KZT53495.1 hypothetical protein CALCODRAFT_486326 [Calocera cornea HHB12733]
MCCKFHSDLARWTYEVKFVADDGTAQLEMKALDNVASRLIGEPADKMHERLNSSIPERRMSYYEILHASQQHVFRIEGKLVKATDGLAADAWIATEISAIV